MYDRHIERSAYQGDGETAFALRESESLSKRNPASTSRVMATPTSSSLTLGSLSEDLRAVLRSVEQADACSDAELRDKVGKADPETLALLLCSPRARSFVVERMVGEECQKIVADAIFTGCVPLLRAYDAISDESRARLLACINIRGLFKVERVHRVPLDKRGLLHSPAFARSFKYLVAADDINHDGPVLRATPTLEGGIRDLIEAVARAGNLELVSYALRQMQQYRKNADSGRSAPRSGTPAEPSIDITLLLGYVAIDMHWIELLDCVAPYKRDPRVWADTIIEWMIRGGWVAGLRHFLAKDENRLEGALFSHIEMAERYGDRTVLAVLSEAFSRRCEERHAELESCIKAAGKQ